MNIEEATELLLKCPICGGVLILADAGWFKYNFCANFFINNCKFITGENKIIIKNPNEQHNEKPPTGKH